MMKVDEVCVHDVSLTAMCEKCLTHFNGKIQYRSVRTEVILAMKEPAILNDNQLDYIQKIGRDEKTGTMTLSLTDVDRLVETYRILKQQVAEKPLPTEQRNDQADEDKVNTLMAALQDRRMFRGVIQRTAKVLGCPPHAIEKEAAKRENREDLPRWFLDISDTLDAAGIAKTAIDGVTLSLQARVMSLLKERDNAIHKCIRILEEQADAYRGEGNICETRESVLRRMAERLKGLIP